MKKFFVCLLVSLLFCTLYGESLVPTVRINEIMSSNGATIADDDGEFEDWIELYNYGDEVVDLSGWGLSDNPNNPFKWTFPEGTMIAPGEYKLVWASGQDRGHLGDFSPLDLQPAIWLRADVVETVEDGGQLRVSRWQDLSGHSRDATQATATRRPVLWPDGAGEGVPVIRFNGSSHYLQFGENAQSVFSSVGGGAIFAVVNPGTSSGTRVVTVFSNGNNTYYRIGLDTVNSEIRAGGRLKDSNTLQEIRAPLTLGKLQLWGVDANWLGRRLRLFVDGVLAAEKTEWLGGGETDSTLSSVARIGSNPSSGNLWNGDIAELLYFNRVLSSEEHLKITEYLRRRYNLSIRQSLHTSYSISSSGESIVLTNEEGVLVDRVDVTALPVDVSYARNAISPNVWEYHTQPTPWEENSAVGYASILPEYSHQGGFYSEPFQLQLQSTGDTVILYTLDGSEPTVENIGGKTYLYKNQYPRDPGDPFGEFLEGLVETKVYSEPISIVDRTAEPNHLSDRSTTYDRDPSAYLPITNVPKGTVVRARVYREGTAPGPVVSSTYFVGSTIGGRFKLPIISLSVNEDSLYDYEKGIFTAGIDFDSWRSRSQAAVGGGSPANWRRRGEENEVLAHFEYFEFEEESPQVSQLVGIRIHGGASRSFPQKTLRIYARGEYGESYINYPLFPGLVGRSTKEPINEFKRLLLRNSGNDYRHTLLRDAFLQRLVRHLGLDYQEYRAATVFINGEYWGLMNMRERVDNRYIASHHGVDPDNVVILSNDAVISEGSASDRAAYLALRNYIAENDMSVPEHYEYVSTQIDLDNFAKYFMVQIYVNNTDWPFNNIDYWRVREPDTSEGALPTHDGRWRWILYDLDFGFGLFTGGDRNVWHNTLEFAITPSDHWSRVMLHNLLKNPEFRNRFVNLFADHMASTFKPSRVNELVDQMHADIAPFLGEHAQRWRYFGDGSVESIKAFGAARPGYVWQHLKEVFGLNETFDVTLASDDSQGRIRINSLVIDRDTPGLENPEQPYPWTATYFADIPVELEALPEEGYRFVGWKVWPTGTGEPEGYYSEEPVIELSLSSNTTVKAQFELIPSGGQPVVLHAWDFEDEGSYLSASYTYGGGTLVVNPGPSTDVVRNTAAQDFATAHLRVNNPLGSTVTLNLPTTGYGEIALSMLTRRSGQGAGNMTVSYTTDGENWIQHSTISVQDAAPQYHRFDFSLVEGAANNPLFAVRLSFEQGSGGTAGNNRFDDIELSGVALPKDPVVLHTWDFEDEGPYLSASYTYGGGTLVVNPGPSTEVVRNTAAQDFATAHLRVNNPLGATVTLNLPTTGFEEIALSMLTRRSGQGAGNMTVSYTTDGENWIQHSIIVIQDAAPQYYRFDFSSIEGVANNPLFAVRLGFEQGSGGTAGNNRFDDIELSGVALPGTKLPPQIQEEVVPPSVSLVSGNGTTYDLTEWFVDPQGEPLSYEVVSSNPGAVVAVIENGMLTLDTLKAGESQITVTVSDGVNAPVSHSFLVLVYPEPFVLSQGRYQFTEWDEQTPAGVYPTNALLLQSEVDDPDLTTELGRAYHIPENDAQSPINVEYPYAATGRTRINGLGEEGLAFINTGRGRDVGAFLLALDTRGVDAAEVGFLAGTVLPNNRVYAIRLQYRVGTEGAFIDVLDKQGNPIEYVRADEGDSVTFGPISLPEDALGQPHVQLLWRYYYISGSGSRAQLRLDDIWVDRPGGSQQQSLREWLLAILPEGEEADYAPEADPTGYGASNLLRYALDLVNPEDRVTRYPGIKQVEGEGWGVVFPFDPSKTDIVFLVEASEDLVNWDRIVFDSRVDEVEWFSDGWIIVRDKEPLPESGRGRFLRLRIELKE